MNLGVHIIKAPSGKYIFRGTLPATLGNVVPATRQAILGNNTLNERGPNNEILMVQFPVFDSLSGAYAHAVERGVTVNSGE
jgi:hypothetical protein